MGDLIGVIIFIGFIVLSLIQKFTQKGDGDGDQRSVEERLEEAIRRSMDRAKGSAEGTSRPSQPPTAPVPPGHAPYRPLPQPQPPRPATRSQMPPPVQRVPRPQPAPTPRRVPAPTPSRVPAPAGGGTFEHTESEPWGTRPERRESRRARSPQADSTLSEGGGTWVDELDAKRRARGQNAERPREHGFAKRAERVPGLAPKPGTARQVFSRRQLQELVLFSELMKRPRIIRDHPMYRHSPRV